MKLEGQKEYVEKNISGFTAIRLTVTIKLVRAHSRPLPMHHSPGDGASTHQHS